MEKPVFFGKSWFRSKKRPTELWSREKARAAHDAKKLYSVFIDGPERLSCFLEINNEFVGVGFLDEYLREYMYYSFSEFQKGQLFLACVTYRQFVDESDLVESGTTYRFEQSGAVKIKKQTFNPLSTERGDGTHDVSGNYARFPEFGEYDELIAIDR